MKPKSKSLQNTADQRMIFQTKALNPGVKAGPFLLSNGYADPKISHFNSKKCKFKESGLHGRVATWHLLQTTFVLPCRNWAKNANFGCFLGFCKEKIKILLSAFVCSCYQRPPGALYLCGFQRGTPWKALLSQERLRLALRSPRTWAVCWHPEKHYSRKRD